MLPGGSRFWLMSALVLSTVMGSLDSSFVPLTFSDLIVKLDTSTSVVVWVALGYLIAATGPMLLMSRLGDQRGHAWLFRAGTLLYGVTTVACGAAPTIGALIALRSVQGLGMAMFLPATFALATRAWPPAERGRPLGILASANATGFVLGPLFAGWLLDAYDWRATFLSRAPLCALGILLAFAAVRPRAGEAFAARTGLDPLGAFLMTAGFFGLLYGLNRIPVEDNHRDPRVWLVFVAGLALFALFVRREGRVAAPLVDVALFRDNPGFSRAALAFIVLFATFPIYLFVLPIVLLGGLEMPAWDAGLLLGSVALVTFFVSPYAGRASDRIGAERLCMIGVLLVMAGYLALLLLRVDVPRPLVLVPMALIGTGTGLFFSPNNRLIITGVPPERAGMASGLIGTMRQSGYAVGFALMASFFTVVQDAFEGAWSRDGLRPLPERVAARLAHVYEIGGAWSPEMLVFICRTGAILAAGLCLFALVASARGLALSGGGRLVVAGFTLLLSTVGVLELALRSDLRVGGDDRWRGAALATATRASLVPVAPFGMAARAPRRFAELMTGPEAFALYCAACHGKDGKGVLNLGVDLTTSAFARRESPERLAAFLREGRLPESPESRTRRLMPGMKNYPSFAPELYERVVSHVKALSVPRRS
jgi:EmrB/QacA subfamily drug resistance transporter